MEFQTVPTLSIIGMIFSVVLLLGIVIALIIVGKTKFNAKLSSFFIGCGVFIVFAMILEKLLHTVMFNNVPILSTNTLCYALYGALAAAVFEETGRFVAMKFLLKKNFNFENAFMYGAGHGGVEAVMILVLTYISLIITSIMINNGMMAATLQLVDEDILAEAMSQYSVLWTTPSYMFFIAGIERLSAIILQIGLSLIMFESVKNHKGLLMAIAYLIHFAVDFIAVMAQSAMPIVVVEIIIAVLAIATFMLSHKISKEYE